MERTLTNMAKNFCERNGLEVANSKYLFWDLGEGRKAHERVVVTTKDGQEVMCYAIENYRRMKTYYSYKMYLNGKVVKR